MNKMEKLPFKTWPYEEQTMMKHKVFQDYFDRWVKILGKYSPLNYVDGFGGCGAYSTGDETYYGSPVIAAKIIKDNQQTAKIVVIEKEKENIENLKSIFSYLKLDAELTFMNDEFDHAVNGIISTSLAPTFFFIDPFGFSNIKYSTLEKIMKIKKSEILLNFMFNGVNRFISLPQNEKIMNDLFGTADWKELKKLESVEKEAAIVNLYRNQLKKVSKFVFPYRIEFPKLERTYYYLFHLTNHPKGASIMKSSFAKFNHGRVAYLGSRGGQLRLSEIGDARITGVEEFLLSKYNGGFKKYSEIIEQNIDETEYLESEITQALKKLEEKNKAYIERFPKLTEKRHDPRRSIDENDLIYFNTFPSIRRKSLLYKTKVEYGDFTINHVFGCAHGCKYPCYAMMMAKTYGRIKDYDAWIHPKIVTNALELLDKEIPIYKNEIEFVHLSFTTDPFMYDIINKRVYPHIKTLTLQIIEKLNKSGIKVTVLTKGTYPEELTDAAKYSKENEYGITIVSLDEKFKKEFEPYSASFEERIKSLKFLHDAGLKTWVSIEPYPTPNILPGSNAGQDLEKILKKISFVDKIIFGKLNYNTGSSNFKNNAAFYEDCTKLLVNFCKGKKISYHVKEGTPGHTPETMHIFEDE